MTLIEITTAIKSIDAIIKFINGLSSLKKDLDIKLANDEILSKLIDTKQQLLIFQSSYSEILSTNSQLEKKIIELEDWNTTKLDYSLVEIAPSIFVHVSKESQKTSNKHPWFCAKCYNEKKLSPFQRKFPKQNNFVCHSCGSEISLPIQEYIPPKRNPEETVMSV